MKTELTKICAALFGLVVCAGIQDMAPTVFGAKPPLLLVFGGLAGIPAAIGAGLFADALGGLPFGGSAFFFAVVALAVRLTGGLSFVILVLAAILYQAGIVLWCRGSMNVQLALGAFLAAAALVPILSAALRLARRRIGIDQEVAVA